MEPLLLYEKNFASEGYVSVLLDESDIPNNTGNLKWVLDLCWDFRIRELPYWLFQTWKHSGGCSDTQVLLERDEVYGFLKSKFPGNDWKMIVKEQVKEKILELLK